MNFPLGWYLSAASIANDWPDDSASGRYLGRLRRVSPYRGGGCRKSAKLLRDYALVSAGSEDLIDMHSQETNRMKSSLEAIALLVCLTPLARADAIGRLCFMAITAW